MASKEKSWLRREGTNKTTLRLEIPNPNANGNTSRWPAITSKCFEVGTKSKFSLLVFTLKGRGMLSAWLRNESDHDVVVDCFFTVGEVGRTFPSFNKNDMDQQIGKKRNLELPNFMRISEVGASLSVTVEVSVKWEDVSEEVVVEQDRVNNSDLLAVERRLREEAGKQEERQAKRLKESEDRMKDIFRVEIAKVQALLNPGCQVDIEQPSQQLGSQVCGEDNFACCSKSVNNISIA